MILNIFYKIIKIKDLDLIQNVKTFKTIIFHFYIFIIIIFRIIKF